MFMSNGEQMASALKDMALASKSYYEELIAQGFNEHQALMMVIEMQRAIFTGGMGK